MSPSSKLHLLLLTFLAFALLFPAGLRAEESVKTQLNLLAEPLLENEDVTVSFVKDEKGRIEKILFHEEGEETQAGKRIK